MAELVPEDGIVKFCWPEELEHLTRMGWKLRSTHPMQDVKHVSDTEQLPLPPNGYYTNGVPTVNINRSLVIDRVGCILVKDASSELAKLAGEADGLRQKALTAINEQRYADEKLKAKEIELEKKEAEFQRLTLANASAAQAVDNLRAVKSALEADLGKVRTEIGAARFKEIVGR